MKKGNCENFFRRFGKNQNFRIILSYSFLLQYIARDLLIARFAFGNAECPFVQVHHQCVNRAESPCDRILRILMTADGIRIVSVVGQDSPHILLSEGAFKTISESFQTIQADKCFRQIPFERILRSKERRQIVVGVAHRLVNRHQTHIRKP